MSNVLAFVGIVCVLVAVGLLTDYRWSLLGLGLVLIMAAYTAHVAEQSSPTPKGGPDEAP